VEGSGLRQSIGFEKDFQNLFFFGSSIRLEMVTASRWGYTSQSLWSERDSIGAIAISDAIASLLLHKNELNKIVSERTQKDEEVRPIPSLLAQFV
jgi:hypothetical protein